MQDFRQLDVWNLGLAISRTVYTLTATFPEVERYGLQQQMRRSAVSIPSNIAEGSARGSAKDFRRFLYIASGSAAELETQLVLAADFGFVARDETLHVLMDDIDKSRAMLGRLIRKLS
jgi:four helix bundle protein